MNRILLGRAELKHSNDKVIVTIYVYNIIKKYLINKINKIPAVFKLKLDSSSKNDRLIEEINIAKSHFTNKTCKASTYINTKLNEKKKSFYLLNKSNNVITDVKTYQKRYMKSYIRKFLRKEIVALFFKQMLMFHKNKFEEKYVLLLANQVSRIFTKKVEFNFVNLKHLYLDSYIFSNALVIKMKKLAKMKKSFLKGVKRFLNMFKVPRINSLDVHSEIYKKKFISQNINLDNATPSIYGATDLKNMHSSHNLSNKILNNVPKSDIIDKLIKIAKDVNTTSLNINKTLSTVSYIYTMGQAFKSSKYKIINGVRLEIAGRFTKRSSAARSVFKIRNKGSIKNKESSEKGLPTTLLKGYSKSNLQYNFLYSKVRGGSFGIKGWLSGA